MYVFKHGDDVIEIELGTEETVLVAKHHIIAFKAGHGIATYTDNIQINFRGSVLMNQTVISALDIRPDEYFLVFIDDSCSPWLRTRAEAKDVDAIVDITTWEKQRDLGKGAYGSVVLYRDPNTEEQWAVKYMIRSDRWR